MMFHVKHCGPRDRAVRRPWAGWRIGAVWSGARQEPVKPVVRSPWSRHETSSAQGQGSRPLGAARSFGAVPVWACGVFDRRALDGWDVSRETRAIAIHCSVGMRTHLHPNGGGARARGQAPMPVLLMPCSSRQVYVSGIVIAHVETRARVGVMSSAACSDTVSRDIAREPDVAISQPTGRCFT